MIRRGQTGCLCDTDDQMADCATKLAREEDRRLGLEVGANAYLTKGSFHDDSFMATVNDLIGEID